MDEKSKDYYRVLAPGVPKYGDVSERLSEAEAGPRGSGLLLFFITIKG